MARRIQGSGQLELDLFEVGEIRRLREENGMLRAVNQRLQTQNTELKNEINRLQRLVDSSVQKDAHAHLDSSTARTSEEASESNTVTDFRTVTKRSNIEDKITLFRNYFTCGSVSWDHYTVARNG
ncbi:MAG: hypothetical protein K6T83_22315 [Alicyclobacillus sp.]|nr:hypothetical protein [Alicyclobacillus sp.]